jgi:hypothetical protein
MTPQSALGGEHMCCALMNEMSAYTQKVAYCRYAAIKKSGELLVYESVDRIHTQQ